ncbi:MAG: nitroreductase family protein [Dysgonamonadaceae bacterium]|jgi:nitroreductase|nr:nitroreductase family protein [Dysgonamonadaceae bacterium]
MSHFTELITHRRSIRKYTEESLQACDVEQIMKAALMSPSSKHSNPWQFILVENKETLKKLAGCKSSGCGFIENCALAIVVLTDPMQSGAFVEDASIVATYIQLQAEDLGLGSCWVQIRGRETETGQDSEDFIRQLLNIPLQMCIVCIIAVGHKEKPGKSHREEDLQWEKIHIETYRYDDQA